MGQTLGGQILDRMAGSGGDSSDLNGNVSESTIAKDDLTKAEDGKTTSASSNSDEKERAFKRAVIRRNNEKKTEDEDDDDMLSSGGSL